MITLLSTAMTNEHFDTPSADHYPVPDNLQQIFGDQFASISLPNNEQLTKEMLSLHCYPEIMDGGIQHVSATENSWQA